MDKQQKKNARVRWKHAQHADLLAGMPLSPQQLHKLLDYLDAHIEDCDHTTKLTAIFLHSENLERDRVLSWLGEQGGFCDCEVLANLADLDELLQKPDPAPPLAIPPKQNRPARSLETITGWNLLKLPGAWRVANPYALTEPIKLELGKKGGCIVQIRESPLPAGDEASDECWTRLWYDHTRLPIRGVLQVSHGPLELLQVFRSTQVRSPSWTPVYCWIARESASWYLEVRTESNRCAGDLPQIAALISALESGMS